jgi:hypothetical protein
MIGITSYLRRQQADTVADTAADADIDADRSGTVLP